MFTSFIHSADANCLKGPGSCTFLIIPPPEVPFYFQTPHLQDSIQSLAVCSWLRQRLDKLARRPRLLDRPSSPPLVTLRDFLFFFFSKWAIQLALLPWKSLMVCAWNKEHASGQHATSVQLPAVDYAW